MKQCSRIQRIFQFCLLRIQFLNFSTQQFKFALFFKTASTGFVGVQARGLTGRFVLGLAIGVLFHYLLYRFFLPVQPFIYVAF